MDQLQMIINPTAVDDGAAPPLAHPRVGEDLLRVKDRRIQLLTKAWQEAEEQRDAAIAQVQCYEKDLAAMREDRDDLQSLFDLQQTRMEKATKMWQQETGRADVQPDLGTLLEWLMGRIESLERENGILSRILSAASKRIRATLAAGRGKKVRREMLILQQIIGERRRDAWVQALVDGVERGGQNAGSVNQISESQPEAAL